MKFYLCFILLFISSSVVAQLYKVVDENGQITYTDTPEPGAVKVELGKVNSVVMPSIAPKVPAKTQPEPQQPVPQYRITIDSPSNGATIRDNLGRFTVTATLEPQTNGIFQLLIDGVTVISQPVPVFELENINRGEHQLQVQFLNPAGRVLASSEERVIYLHKASQLINAN